MKTSATILKQQTDMCYFTHFKEYGWQCELVRPYRGYHRGTIIGKNDGRFVVEFSSGMTEEFYADEIYFD